MYKNQEAQRLLSIFSSPLLRLPVRGQYCMLQEVVDEFLTTLSIEDTAPDGTSEGVVNRNTVVAYRNDLTQACAYLTRQQVLNWQEVTREHIAGYLLEM